MVDGTSSELKSAEEILEKHKNDEHHDEFGISTGINSDDVEKYDSKKGIYLTIIKPIKKDLNSEMGEIKLIVPLLKSQISLLPNYLIENKDKYSTSGLIRRGS